jgi:hypothetical protein
VQQIRFIITFEENSGFLEFIPNHFKAGNTRIVKMRVQKLAPFPKVAYGKFSVRVCSVKTGDDRKETFPYYYLLVEIAFYLAKF